MSSTESDPEDAITKEEIAGTAPTPAHGAAAGVSQGTKRNACKWLRHRYRYISRHANDKD